jgi:excisionase family DNA binding protein
MSPKSEVLSPTDSLPEPIIFTIAAAVDYLKKIGVEDVTEWTLHQKIREGKLPALRIGRKHKVSKDDLIAMLKSLRRARG